MTEQRGAVGSTAAVSYTENRAGAGSLQTADKQTARLGSNLIRIYDEWDSTGRRILPLYS